jgi:curved DNA-binding protein CbpA
MRRVSGVDPALFRQLGVPPSASASEIRQAYRSALRRLHPDAVEGAGSVTELGSVVRAYRTLERAGATQNVRTVDPQPRRSIDVYA